MVDGASTHVGSYREEVGSAIDQAKQDSPTAAAVSVAKDGGRLTIDVGGGRGPAKVLLIGFDHDHETSIRHGENGGRTLEEANVVRSIRTVGDWQGAPLREREVPRRPGCSRHSASPRRPHRRRCEARRRLSGSDREGDRRRRYERR